MGQAAGVPDGGNTVAVAPDAMWVERVGSDTLYLLCSGEDRRRRVSKVKEAQPAMRDARKQKGGGLWQK